MESAHYTNIQGKFVHFSSLSDGKLHKYLSVYDKTIFDGCQKIK